MNKLNILIYGATGFVGDSVISLIREHKSYFNIKGMTCGKNIEKLSMLAKEFNTRNIGIATYSNKLDYQEYFPDRNIFFGLDEFIELIDENIDIVVFAISGVSILNLSLEIAKSGKTVGMANKESIISLGNILLNTAKLHNTKIVPLDSEHNSIYQLLSNNNSSFKSIAITATGGPFLNREIENFKDIKVEEAINHPIWKMGKKISVDSATMINKGLELIEAKYLFDLDVADINVLIHPQAIVHGLVTYRNNSTICFMSYPDMRIPISNLLFSDSKNYLDDLYLDLTKVQTLDFYNVDEKKFPAIQFARDVVRQGGLAPNGFNYANDKLVSLFLKKKIGFLDIVNFNMKTLEKYFAYNYNIEMPTVEDIFIFNKWIDKNIYLGE